MSTHYILNFKQKERFLRETGNDILYAYTDEFNCGGFALNQFEWYCPYDYEYRAEAIDLREQYDDGYISRYDELCDLLADIFVRYMEHDIACREIVSEADLEDDEYLVAFKASYDDFHYARKFSDGKWYHKMGGSKIEEVTEEEVYSHSWWEDLPCGYDGELRLLAVRKTNFKELRIANNRRRHRGGIKCFG